MELSDSWQVFVDTEFNVFEITLFAALLYLGIAVLCWLVIPASGPVLLKRGYFKNIEQYSYDDNGVANIVFRILAPIFASYFFLVIAFILWNIVSPNWTPQIRWMPIMLYWVIFVVISSSKHGASYPVWTLIIQALTSLAAAVYFDWAVVCRIPEEGIFAFDQSNIGWQLLVISFFAIGLVVLFGIRRGLSRYNERLFSAYSSKVFMSYGRSGIDPKAERKIFSYMRMYDKELPATFRQDVLLRALFYTIMLVEDSNRPKWFRFLERLLFWTGKIRSTGIMQVRSSRKLTDLESVRESIPKVQEIWDSVVVQIARSCQGNYSPTISFTGSWYKYNYYQMKYSVIESMSYIYGQYCGTFTLDAGETFRAVAGFLSARDGSQPYVVYVESGLFEEPASLLPGREVCFDRNRVSLLADDIPSDGCLIKLINNEGPERKSVEKAVSKLSDVAMVTTVEFIPQVRCAITVLGKSNGISSFSADFPGWIIVNIGEEEG